MLCFAYEGANTGMNVCAGGLNNMVANIPCCKPKRCMMVSIAVNLLACLPLASCACRRAWCLIDDMGEIPF